MYKFETVIDFLNHRPVRERLGMWIGSEKITDLYFVIWGFDLSVSSQTNFTLAFSTWLAEHYGYSGSASLAWPNFIMSEECLDEYAAVPKFFELFDRFQSERKLSED